MGLVALTEKLILLQFEFYIDYDAEDGGKVLLKCNDVETVVQLVNIGVKPDYTVRLEVDVDEFYKTVGEDKRDYLDSEEYKKIKARNQDK